MGFDEKDPADGATQGTNDTPPDPQDDNARHQADADALTADRFTNGSLPHNAIHVTEKWHQVVDKTIKRLPLDERLYCRSEALVEVISVEDDFQDLTQQTKLSGVRGSPKIIVLSEANVGCAITRNARLVKESKLGNMLPAQPPAWLIRAVATKKHWPGVRPLDMIAECPFPRADGSIVERPGYDHETRTLYAPSMDFPAMPDAPTQDDARAAWARLYRVVEQFPFAADGDRAAWLAGLLTVIARPSIKGPVPGVAFIGNKAGTGKGLLINVIGNITHGRDVPTSAYNHDTEETDKVMTSLAIENRAIVHFDNLEEGGSYGNAALDRAMTSLTLNNRILCKSKMSGDVMLAAVFFLSGNNIAPAKDAFRRWLTCNLVTTLEHPEERYDLQIKDLRSHVLGRRGELVRDALTILKAHALARRPTGKWASLGSFERWDTVVRGAVHFATGCDCYATAKNVAEDSDDKRQKRAVIQAWADLARVPGYENGLTTNSVISAVQRASNSPADLPPEYDRIAEIIRCWNYDGSPATPKQLGKKIASMKNSPITIDESKDRKVVMTFIECSQDRGSKRWKVDVSETYPSSQDGPWDPTGQFYASPSLSPHSDAPPF